MRASLLRCIVASCVLLLFVASSATAGDLEQKLRVNKDIQLLTESVGGTVPLLTTSETEPNDDCAGAEAYVDAMTGAIDPSGDEDWYWFDAQAGDCVTIGTDSWNASTTDTQVYLYDAAGCGDPLGYLVWNDDAGPGLFSLIEDYELPGAGTYYVRVKHYSASGTGEYVLTVELATCPAPPEPPANDTCADAELLACNSVVVGSTDLAANDLEDLSETCVDYGADGPDVFYQVCVPPSHKLSAILIPDGWDPALWIVADCTDETSCLDGADAGFFNDPETVEWVNESESEVCVYVIPDSYIISVSGDFTLEVSCDQVVATDGESWGAVKAQYQD